jgi:deazaflavin-dependent oxidoreductase (nitroreductase family)
MEVAQLRRLGVSGLTILARRSFLVLETVGRRSGRTRRTPVSYLLSQGAYRVGGGAAGMTRVDWVANLRQQPVAAVWLGRRRFPVRVRELQGDEYRQAREQAIGRWPGVARYEETSGRPTPYFELTPLDSP